MSNFYIFEYLLPTTFAKDYIFGSNRQNLGHALLPKLVGSYTFGMMRKQNSAYSTLMLRLHQTGCVWNRYKIGTDKPCVYNGLARCILNRFSCKVPNEFTCESDPVWNCTVPGSCHTLVDSAQFRKTRARVDLIHMELNLIDIVHAQPQFNPRDLILVLSKWGWISFIRVVHHYFSGAWKIFLWKACNGHKKLSKSQQKFPKYFFKDVR